MASDLSRRKFITSLGLAAGGLSFGSWSANRATIAPDMKLAYSAITWGGNDVQAIKDIAGLGFKGIQLRSNVVKDFGTKPEEMRALLEQHKLKLPMFSSGNANINTGNDAAVIETHVSNAKFVKALGGANIQVTNSSRPKAGDPSTEDLVKYGKLINEIGKRTQEIGVQTNYHNHMGQLGQTPEEVRIILENCDSKNVHFLLDIAHYFQGGGDPVTALNSYKDRIHALHLKDVRQNAAGESKAYTFVELGQGKVNLPAFFKALDSIRFNGWGVVELDAVPDKDKTPVQCGTITKAYLESLKIKV
ncbi:sugar phosphate isomerase/epimerase [Segetibacter sp.]|jgi:inosose dehydratase|uniref:sugar phosphate isomerase/epimerase family protein n=1 Tax=Segetibacter sp. TaxID=2231182 RepID=UPI0026230BDF|nr:sugar phosphate isomerase/epimerase [Segetibacter sp.]MCW3078838.1 xylose isomerase [Segetibacter sp.]